MSHAPFSWTPSSSLLMILVHELGPTLVLQARPSVSSPEALGWEGQSRDFLPR